MDSIPVVLSDLTEDAPKTTFDFWRDDDTQMDTIDEVAQALGTNRLGAAIMVADYPFSDAVPSALLEEAQRVLED